MSSWTDVLLKVVTDLGTGDDRLPLERVMRRHVGIFADLIAAGRTWPQIAAAMTRAGARHKRGQPIDPKQLRTVFGRIVRALATGGAPEFSVRGVAFPAAAPQPSQFGAPPTATSSPEIGRAPRRSAITPQAADIMSKLSEVRAKRSAVKRDFDE